MWSYYAVETFKCHVEYEQSTTHVRSPVDCDGNSTVPIELSWGEDYKMILTQILCKTCKNTVAQHKETAARMFSMKAHLPLFDRISKN